MEANNESLRDRLMSGAPEPGDVSNYRQQVSSTIAANQKRIRRERLLTMGFWGFCAITATMGIWFVPGGGAYPREPFVALIFFIWGATEVVKHYINASRIEMLKELKQVQIQLFDLQASAGPKQ